jgi:hypothetical protein
MATMTPDDDDKTPHDPKKKREINETPKKIPHKVRKPVEVVDRFGGLNRFDWMVTECQYVEQDRLWQTVVVKEKISTVVYFPSKQGIHSIVHLDKVS